MCVVCIHVFIYIFCNIKGERKNISRNHGEIKWDSTQKCWKLKVLSKNGCYINGEQKQQYSETLLINNNFTPIKMGDAMFYFCPPKIIK